jgi:flagellar biosynthesis protein FlhB
VSDETDQESKTEAASAQRLQRAYEEGQVPVGHDAVLVAGLATGTLVLVALAGVLRSGLGAMVAETAGRLDRTPFGDLPALAVRPVAAVVAVCAAAAAASIAATMAQTRGGFWPHLPAPDLARLFDLGKVTALVKREFLGNLGLALLKVAAVGWAGWWAVRDDLASMTALLTASPGDQLDRAFGLLARAARPVLVAIAAVAGADFLLQRFRFARRMRMTKEEARREYKEEEGDPTVRGRRKKKHREMIRNRARVEVPRADALLVNPTHIAIALRYRKDEGRAPRVTAKGKGVLAEHMRELAREHGIPIVEDIPLARLLYRKVKVGKEIPAQTYKAVAAILAFVYRVTGRRERGARA